MQPWKLTMLITTSLALAACGDGGGGSIASAPPPIAGPVSVTAQTIVNRTLLPQTVATTPGTYDTIAYLTDQAYEGGAPGAKTGGIVSPSPIRITIAREPPAFTVLAHLPDGDIQRTYQGSSANALRSSVFTNEFYGDFGYRIDFVYSFSDGTQSSVRTQDITQFVAEFQGGPTPGVPPAAGPYERSGFGTSLGQRYVSVGEWGVGDYLVDATSNRQTRARTAVLVYGARTAPADVPTSGKASYADATGVLHLDADFGARTIAAVLDYPAQVVDEVDDFGQGYTTVQVGIRASGSSPLAPSADFAIPLAGNSITPDANRQSPDRIAPVTGTFTGAFFGPQAAEAGGFAEIVKGNGEQLWAGVPFLLGR